MSYAEAGVDAVEPDVDRIDLSSAFGDSAAGALRGLLAPRRAPVQAVGTSDDRPDTEVTGEPSDPDVTGEPSDPEVTGEPIDAEATGETSEPGTGGPGDAEAEPEPGDVRPAPPAPATADSTSSGSTTPGQGARDGRAPGDAAPEGGTGARAVPAQRRRPRSARVRDRDDVDLLLLAVARDGVAGGREIIAQVRERTGGAVELTERRVYHELHRLRDKRLIADAGRGEQARYVLTDVGERILVARTHRWQAYAHAMNRVLEE